MLNRNIEVFSLGDALSNTAFRGSVKDVTQIWCAQRGEPVSAPIVVRHMSGRVLQDFMWTGAVAPLVNERVISLLEESDVNGWRTYPIDLRDASEKRIDGYVGLAFTGRCDWIDFDRREEALIYRPNRSGGHSPHFRGLEFDRQSWDGSDFFMDANAKTGWVLVTDKVRNVFQGGKIKNCQLEPLAEMEMLAERSAIIRSTGSTPAQVSN